MKPKNYAQAITAPSSVCLILFSSCQNYQPFSDEEMFRWSYEQNFTKTFGPIASDQGWDFSAMSPQNVQTRTEEEKLLTAQHGGYFEVNASLYQYIIDHIQFTDKVDRSFALRVEKDDFFEIIPVYQTPKTVNGWQWDLQVFANTNNLTNNYTQHSGWPMGQDMYVKRGENREYESLKDNICTPWGVKSGWIIQYKNTDDEDQLMYFNLLVTDHSSIYKTGKYAPKGTQQSSLNYQMRVINPSEPMLIEGYKAMFIACDAANFDSQNPYLAPDGKRYQSLVFMVVGPRIPDVVYLEEDQQGLRVEKSSTGKRYMIEDMGSTSDFDFNDIVVDVSQRTMVDVRIVQKQQSKDLNYAIKTEVSLGNEQNETTMCYKYLCGTKPFQLTAGDYESQIITDPTDQEQSYVLMQPAVEDDSSVGQDLRSAEHHIGWIPDPAKASFSVSGWDPEQNNLSVTVWRNGMTDKSDGGWKVQFPADGEVPYIMALPVGEPWSSENIPFIGWKKYLLAK